MAEDKEHQQRPDPGADGAERAPRLLDTSRPHMARVYDYWLGGKNNFAADREAGDQAMQEYPGLRQGVQAQRAFLRRAVRFLAGEQGIRQFLDIGTGLPAADNTHEVAQAVAPECRIVYVDNDPLVLSHARALLTSDPAGATDYLDADLRDPGLILERAAGTLDFGQPIALMLIGVLQLIGDADQPHAIVARLVDAVPSGSWLAVAHPASDILPDQIGAVAAGLNRRAATPTTLRNREQVTAFFTGTALIPPGVVQLHRWDPAVGHQQAAGPGVIPLRPGNHLPADGQDQIAAYCGLGRKP